MDRVPRNETREGNMNQLTKIEELIGKTIVTAALHETSATLFFNNGEMALISLCRGWEDGDDELVVDESINDLPLYEKRALKIITETEYNALDYGRRAEQKEELEKHERKIYEDLKKKFGEG
jgi:hypothetical protein